MIFKAFHNLELSALGFGAMRLPVINGDDSQVDETAAARMVDRAMAAGINYYDTAWGYHGGNSELVLGRALGRYPWDKSALVYTNPICVDDVQKLCLPLSTWRGTPLRQMMG